MLEYYTKMEDTEVHKTQSLNFKTQQSTNSCRTQFIVAHRSILSPNIAYLKFELESLLIQSPIGHMLNFFSSYINLL
jgi:hypothetical protein